MFDEIIARFFDDEDTFKKAMKVLGKYDDNTKGGKTWEEVDNYLATISGGDSSLLERAIDYRAARDKNKKAPVATQNPNDTHTLEILSTAVSDLREDVKAIRGPGLDSKPLMVLIDEFIAERKERWNAKNIQKNTDSMRPKLALLVDVVGDIQSDQLQPKHIVEYKRVLLALPSNRTKGGYANKTTNELAEMDLPKSVKMKGATLESYIARITAFLKWMKKNNHAIDGLSDSLQGMQFDTKPDHEQRPAFEDDELAQLFESRQYTKTGHKQASHYWVPLLALFTGARQGELCQLYKSDIQKNDETGIWYLDINQNTPDKSLKKKHHARLVPIHKTLRDMGFLDYVDSVKQERIFPDLPRKRDGYGQKFSRWFCDTYLNDNNCGIKTKDEADDDSPVFHSFRHTVETQLDHKHNVAPHHIAHLVGQKPEGKSVTTNRYIKPKQLRDNQKIINKLDYPSIDFDKIRHWKRGFKPYNPTK